MSDSDLIDTEWLLSAQRERESRAQKVFTFYTSGAVNMNPLDLWLALDADDLT